MRFQGDPVWDAVFRDRAGLVSSANVGNLPPFVTRRFLKSFSVTRELSGDVPDSVSLLGGAVSAYAKLSCDRLVEDAPDAFSSIDRNTVLGRVGRLAAGYANKTLSLLSGRVRSISVAEASGTTDIELMENSDRLRAPLSLPAFGSQAHPMTVSRVLRYPTNLTAIVVAALHRCGVRVTPAPRADCVLSVPLAFGLLADVGWTVPSGPGVPEGVDWLVAGRFGMMPKHLSGVAAWQFSGFPAVPTTWATGASAQVEFWYHHEPGVVGRPVVLQASGAGDPFEVAVSVKADSSFCLSSWFGGSWVDRDASAARRLKAGWNHLAFEVRYGTGGALLWRDAVLESSPYLGDLRSSGELRLVHVEPGRLQGLNLYFRSSGALTAPNVYTYDVVPQAELDRAFLDVDVVPDVSGRVAWEVCKEVASAELGMVGFDEDGTFFFKNRDTLNGSRVPVATWATDVVADLAASASVDSIRTRVTARVTKQWMSSSGRGAETSESTAVPSFLATEHYVFRPGVSSHLLFGDAPFLAESSRVTIITSPGQAWGTDVGMVLCKDAAGLVLETRPLSGWVTATIRPLGASTWELTVKNSLTYPLYPVWPAYWTGPALEHPPYGLSAGDPALWVLGRRYDASAPFPIHAIDVVDDAALTVWGDRTLDLGESPWRQDPAAVRSMAVRMLADVKEPRMEIGDITLPADLRWQIGDPVRVTDWQGRVPDFIARITRSEITVSLDVENGMTGVYSLRSLPGS